MSRRILIGGLGAGVLATASLSLAKERKHGVSSLVFSYSNERDTIPVTLEIFVRGSGPLVVMVASLGRGASDFDDLAKKLAAAGFRTAAINPRGIGKSSGPALQSLDDCARDVAEVVRKLQRRRKDGSIEPAILIGHAFGNRVARSTAAFYPDTVSSLILLASGGQVPIPPAAAKALGDVFDISLSPAEHIAAVRTAFFAPGNDPEVWRDGWYADVAKAQITALQATPREAWTRAGSVPIMIIQAADDVVAPPANAEALRAAFPDRITVEILPNAGHAMLPEQPELLARMVTARLIKTR